MRDLNERRMLAANGVAMLDSAVYLEPEWEGDVTVAMDAQPQLVTQANYGVPAFLANIVDPQVIDVVMAPLLAAEIAGGEVQKGSWTDLSIMMPMAEPTGNVVAYGDYDNGGSVDANIEWVTRQPFHYQTIKRIGEREQAQWGVASIDMNARKDMAVARTFAEFRNRSYFYGIAGLMNYGLLNDPSLPTAVSPTTKTAGGTTWPVATASEIYEDFLKLWRTLQAQMGGNLQMNERLVLSISTNRMDQLQKLSAFNVSVRTMLRENFPNLEIRAAPQFSTQSGELAQLSLPDWEGVETTWLAFTDRFRAHPVVQELSAFAQKYSAGTWGAIIRRPIAISQMIGI